MTSSKTKAAPQRMTAAQAVKALDAIPGRGGEDLHHAADNYTRMVAVEDDFPSGVGAAGCG